MKKLITLIVMISFVLASCGGTSSTDKDTLNVEIPLKLNQLHLTKLISQLKQVPWNPF